MAQSNSSQQSPTTARAPGRHLLAVLRPWIETAIVTALMPAIGWLRNPDDPFFATSFPWVLLAPLILGLQNGFRYALTSGAALLAGALFMWHGRYASTEGFPVSYALSVGLLGALAGEYRDSWQRALATARRDSDSRGRRLEEFTRAYHLLKRSHDELEQRVAGSGPSLQSALSKVQAQLARASERSLASAGEHILGLFATHGAVQVASLHAVPGQAKNAAKAASTPALAAAPAATLGAMPDIDLAHPMILDSLETGELTSVREDRAGARGPMPLVCIPLTDSGGQVQGMVLVHELPFMLMHDEHMTLLATMGGRIGDWLVSAEGGADEIGDEAAQATEPRGETPPQIPADISTEPPAETPADPPTEPRRETPPQTPADISIEQPAVVSDNAAAKERSADDEPAHAIRSLPAN